LHHKCCQNHKLFHYSTLLCLGPALHMKVLKFGGTSVANAENIEKVIGIIKEKLGEEALIVIVSALGGTTDALLDCGKLAAAGNELYKEKLQEIEQRHITTVKDLIPVQHQSALLSQVKKMCNEIEDLCNGIFLLNELSPASLASIMIFRITSLPLRSSLGSGSV